MIPDNKKRGEWAEAHFIADALMHGWQIFSPHGESGPYDVIIAKGVMMHTIQIKSTFGSSKTRSKWTVSRGANHNKSYHRGVDFFAFYCDHTKVWRFIRQSRIAGRKTYSIRYDENKTKNNWHELENND